VTKNSFSIKRNYYFTRYIIEIVYSFTEQSVNVIIFRMSTRIEEPLVAAFKEIPSRKDPSFREERSAFLKEVGRKYFALKHQDAVLKTDRFLYQAERIACNETFQEHPASLLRLTPLAKRYLGNYEAFTRLLNEGTYLPKLLEHSVVALVDSHLCFAHQLTQEIKQITPYAKTCISITHPKTVDAFHQAGRALFMASNPEEFAVKLETTDPSLFLDIPRYVLINPYTSDTPVIPEIFADCIVEVAEQKQDFEKLGGEEKASLLKGAPNTEDAISLFRRMSTTLSRVERGANAQTFNTAMNLTLLRLQNDGQMLAAFKEALAAHDISQYNDWAACRSFKPPRPPSIVHLSIPGNCRRSRDKKNCPSSFNT